MKLIQFKNESAQKIYADYLNRCKRAIKILNDADKKDCLLEINSHIYEYLEANSEKDEIENLLNILERLGPPEETLRELVAVKKIDQAVRSLNPKILIQALLLNIRNGFIYIFLSILMLFLSCFLVLSILKLIYPEKVGYFVRDHSISFGFVNTHKNSTEILGNWFIPMAIFFAAILYFIIIITLKFLNKKK